MLTLRTYRLFLRTGVNETGLPNAAAIAAALAAIAASNEQMTKKIL
jgi:hypothetical protein